MSEDICVCEDQGWYCLVALVGDYLLVYFLLHYDITSGNFLFFISLLIKKARAKDKTYI
jgi:hypothetical protein